MFNTPKELPLTRDDLKLFVSGRGKAVARLCTAQDDWYAGIVLRAGILKGCFYLLLKPLTHYHHTKTQLYKKLGEPAPLFNADAEIPFKRIAMKRFYPFFFTDSQKIVSSDSKPDLLEIKSHNERIMISLRPHDIAEARKLLRLDEPST